MKDKPKIREVAKHIKEAGEEIASCLMDATIQKAFGDKSLGGCEKYSIENFPPKYHYLIEAYLYDKISSVEAIYLAMREAEMKKERA